MPKMWFYTLKNITTFNHKITSNILCELPHQQKNMTHKGHILHQQKIWLMIRIIYMSRKYESSCYIPHQPKKMTYKLQESFSMSIENSTHKNHFSHQYKS